MLTRNQLDVNIKWLLQNSSTPVKYLTRLNILCEDAASGEMVDLWRQVGQDPLSLEIFRKQRDDGSWCSGGPWAPGPTYVQQGGCSPVSPKYVTTVWILSILGDMGYTVEDPRVAKACEWTLSFQRPNGTLSESRRPPVDEDYDDAPRNVPCRMSIQLNGLAKVGSSSDPRVRKALDVLVRWQREDGGWVQEGHKDGTAAPYKIWDRSCPWASFFAVSALYHANLPYYFEDLMQGLSFLLWHLDHKSEDDVKRFFWHGHEIVKELLMFSENGFKPEQRSIKILLDWLEGMCNPDEGHFHYKGKAVSKMTRKADGGDPRVKKYRLFHLIEDDWLTYWLTRIEKNFQK